MHIQYGPVKIALHCVVCTLVCPHIWQLPSKTSVVSLNMDYSNKRTKFKITASLQKDSQQVWECLHC